MDLTPKDIERFWSKVAKGDPDECWEWQGGRRKANYGGFKVRQVSYLASRVAFFIANGYLPEVVRHDCDNPPCVNPAHLRAGTQEENMADAALRQRSAHKLTIQEARQIARSTDKGRDLAKRYGVSEALVSMIRNGKARTLGPA